MDALYVLYDETCAFCCRCAEWLKEQHAFVRLECFPAGAAETKRRFPVSEGHGAQELIAVDSEGGVYRDTDAFIVTLWALRGWREWALKLGTPSLKPLARRVFGLAGTWRHGLSRLLRARDSETAAELGAMPEPERCEQGACELPRCRSCGAATAGGHAFCAKCLAAALSG